MNKDNLIEFAKEQCEIFPEDSYMGKYLRETLKMLQTEPCEDAISRENAMSMILCYGNEIKAEVMDDIKASMIKLPSVTPTQRWIPVSERLPENETRVLTTIKIPNRIARVRSGWYDSGFIHNDNGGFFHNDNGDVWKATDMEVLAWMPLPKPMKAGEDKR